MAPCHTARRRGLALKERLGEKPAPRVPASSAIGAREHLHEPLHPRVLLHLEPFVGEGEEGGKDTSYAAHAYNGYQDYFTHRSHIFIFYNFLRYKTTCFLSAHKPRKTHEGKGHHPGDD